MATTTPTYQTNIPPKPGSALLGPGKSPSSWTGGPSPLAPGWEWNEFGVAVNKNPAPKSVGSAKDPTMRYPGDPGYPSGAPAPVAGLKAAAPPSAPISAPVSAPIATPLGGAGGAGGIGGAGGSIPTDATGAQMLNAPNALRQGIGTRIPPALTMALAGLQRIY